MQKQRNYCVVFLKWTKNSYYEGLSEKKITESQQFKITVKVFTSTRSFFQEKEV